MLFKSLGFLTSIGNISIISILYYNNKLFHFGADVWNIALVSMVFLSILSTTFFWLNNQKEGINVLKIYGSFYATFALLIYSYWSFKNLFFDLNLEAYLSLFTVFTIFMTIAALSILTYRDKQSKKLLSSIASAFSILTVLISFGLIYKYIFLQTPLSFDAVMLELFTVVLGSVLFLSTYFYEQQSI